MPKPKDPERDARRQKVAEFYLQGITSPSEIAQKLGGVSSRTITSDLAYLRKQIDRKAVKTLEQRKKKSLAKIGFVIKKAWEIFSNTQYAKPETKLSAQRVIISALELEAKVDGLIAEKLSMGPEQASQALLKRLREIEVKAKDDGNGCKEGAIESAELRSET